MRKNGFTIVETALSILILSVISISMIKYIGSASRSTQIQKELDYMATLESGIKESAEQILDMYEPICSVIPSNATTAWGWAHASCNTTSPFPTFVAPNLLRYDLQLNSLTAADRITLRNAIVGSYAPYCELQAETNLNLTLQCPNLRNIQYDLGAGFVARAHTLGQDLNPFVIPNVRFHLTRHEKTGALTDQFHTPTLVDFYQKRRQIGLEKIHLLQNLMKTFYNSKLSVEVANAPVSGLNSVDDEFVPWQWEMFGENTAQVLGAVCTTAAGQCANLNNTNIWRTALSANGLFMRRAYMNLAGGDSRYSVDGFGNQLFLYPMMSQCANADILTCGTVAPPVPQDNYFNIARPPYSSALFIRTFRMQNVVAPAYGRTIVSY